MKKLCSDGFPEVRNGYVFDSHADLLPDYRINSFTSRDLAVHFSLAQSVTIDQYFDNRFATRTWAYTASGSHGIAIALNLLKLAPMDCVTILTSTGNSYISGCVTREIERVCTWSREMTAQTKAIFVNHEFGIAYPELESLKSYGLPIIEDCCYAFSIDGDANKVSRVGDFVIYSFAKYFSLQFGGIIVANTGTVMDDYVSAESKKYLQTTLSHYQSVIGEIATQRIANYQRLTEVVAPLGLVPRFELRPGDVPGVFMFRAEAKWDLPALKSFLWSKGIQCSVFYGEQAFFLPVHQNLTSVDFGYFYECLRQFIEGK